VLLNQPLVKNHTLNRSETNEENPLSTAGVFGGNSPVANQLKTRGK
jgi:hypothetical protein